MANVSSQRLELERFQMECLLTFPEVQALENTATPATPILWLLGRFDHDPRQEA